MSTATRRERREQERERRERRSTGAPPKRTGSGPNPLLIGVALVVVIAAVVFGGRALGVFAPGPAPFDIRAAKYDPLNEVIGTHEADENNGHVNAGQKVSYKTDPPTSGAHWGSPAAPTPWGIKDVTIPNEVIVHNLEHGGIVIFYKALTQEELDKLKDLVRVMAQNGFPKVILEPYPTLRDGRIALSAWRWSLKLPSYDDVQIVKFVRSHYQSPEAPEPTVP